MRDRLELCLVDVDRDDLRAERLRDLHAVAADAAGADDDREAARRDAGAPHRLVRRGQRVGDDRDVGERESRCVEALFVDFAKPAARHDDVRREPALDVVARHLLRAADRRQTALAEVAFAARQHGGDDHRLADPALGARSGRDDVPADLVAERQRQRMVGPHAVVEVAEVGVADAAAGDRHHDFAGARVGGEGRALERRLDCRHQPAAGFDAHCDGPPSLRSRGPAASPHA